LNCVRAMNARWQTGKPRAKYWVWFSKKFEIIFLVCGADV
jgi:hypothetical protein